MPISLRAAGVAAALLAASATPAAAAAVAPPTLEGTELRTPPPEGDPGGATVEAVRCSTSSGFAAFTATGTAVNGEYVGPYRENAASQLGAGGLSEDFEPRPLRAAGHLFAIDSLRGEVSGTQRALDQADAATCVKPYFDTANLYYSYAVGTEYSARIDTPTGVYVDRGEGFASVDIVEGLDDARSANTLLSFETSGEGTTRLLRRRDCRHAGFAELAYASENRCLQAADGNQAE